MAGKGGNSHHSEARQQDSTDQSPSTNDPPQILNSQTKEQLDSNSATSCEVAPPIPPDGGYGWVIMFASFICNVIVDGVCFSVGIFFLEFIKYYGASKSKTSWVGSVLNGMYLSMGPIVSALANRFGCRAVTIAGSIVATLAYILSTFSPNIDILILTYGALGGAGFGLMYLPAIVMVGYYFEKKRAFATGVAVCGSGIGAFVFAPMTERLIAYYGWKGATWIVAGIVLNGVVMGALFRPLEASCKVKKQKVVAPEDNRESKAMITNEGVSPPKIQVNGVNGGKSEIVDDRIVLKVNNAVINDDPGVNNEKSYVCSMHDLSPCDDSTSATKPLCRVRHLSKSADQLHHGHRQLRQHQKRDQDELRQQVLDIRRPMYRKDIFYSGSITNLPEYKMSSTNDVTYTQSVTSIPRDKNALSEPGESKSGGCLRVCSSLTDTLGTMTDFSLLKDPVFALYGASCFLCMTGFFVPFMYLPDNAMLKGIPRGNAAFLLSIIGIANTVARVVCGWVSDQPWADCLLINNLALIIGGTATIISPFCNSYGLLAAYAAIFGSGIAVFVSLRSIIMVELLGLERLTNAFGLVTMCQGLSAFIGAPIAGAIYDATGDYAISFYFAGTTLLLAGVICLPLRRIARWQKKRRSVAEGKMCQEERARMIHTNGV